VHEPYLSFLTEQKKAAPYIVFYFLEAGKESGFVAVGSSRSVGARRGVPSVVLPAIASAEAFFVSSLGPHTPLPALSCCPPVRGSSALHRLPPLPITRKCCSYVRDSLQPGAGIRVCSSTSVPGLGIGNCELLSTFLPLGQVLLLKALRNWLQRPKEDLVQHTLNLQKEFH